MTSVCMGPFRIAEGEQEPENCWPNEADGWRVWVNDQAMQLAARRVSIRGRSKFNITVQLEA